MHTIRRALAPLSLALVLLAGAVLGWHARSFARPPITAHAQIVDIQQFQLGTIERLWLDQLVRMHDTANEIAIGNYELALDNWKQNEGIYRALKLAVPPRPAPPRLVIVDRAKAIELFREYAERATNAPSSGVSAELDVSPALKSVEFAPPPPAKPAKTKPKKSKSSKRAPRKA